MTNFERVREFHERFGVPVGLAPAFPMQNRRDRHDHLINEENTERMLAEAEGNLVEVADALTDMLYVIYSCGHEYGIDLDKSFAEVHRSNMSKLGADGKPIYRESDKKVLKGPNYSPPDLAKVLGIV